MKTIRFKGYTLIEVLVASTILVILLSGVTALINPAKQFAKARNAKRFNDVKAIHDAIKQFSQDNHPARLPSWVQRTVQTACNNRPGSGADCTGKYDLRTHLFPNYVGDIPADPLATALGDTAYNFYKNAQNCLIVYATLSELNQPIWAGCRPNFVLSFNQKGEYAWVPGSPSLNNFTEMTVELWVKLPPDQGNDGNLISRPAAPYENQFFIRRRGYTQWLWYSISNGHGGAWEIHGEFAGTNPKVVVDNQWHHVVLQCDGSVFHTFIDGQIEHLGECSEISHANNPVQIGGSIDHPTSAFSGAIDKIRISNKARYSDNFIPPTSYTPDSATVAIWDFQEGGGNSFVDLSGNGNDGTLEGSVKPLWTIDPDRD